MYHYERKYLEKIIEILSKTKAEYNEKAEENSNSVYMNFLSSLYSCFPIDTFDWSELSEKKRNNAKNAFSVNPFSTPICIVDQTVMHGAKRGALFTQETIYLKNLLEKAEYFQWKDIIKYEIFMLKDDSNIFEIGEIQGASNSILNPLGKLRFAQLFPDLCTIRVAKSLANDFMYLREKLCNDTELNAPYIDHINSMIKCVWDMANECSNKEKHDVDMQLHDLRDILQYIYKIMQPVNSENNKVACNHICYGIAICAKLSALSQNQQDSLMPFEAENCSAHEAIEALMTEIQNAYLNEHYEEHLQAAQAFFEKKDYNNALKTINKAQTLIHSVESDYLKLIVLTECANAENRFNTEEISNLCQSIDLASIPSDISQRLAANHAQCEKYIDDLKENMLDRVKEYPTKYFTKSKNLMFLTDCYEMTPVMYGILYNYPLDLSALDGHDKETLLSHKNVFQHNILDLAALASEDVYYKIRIDLDEQFAAEEQAFQSQYKWKKRMDGALKVLDVGTDIVNNLAASQIQEDKEKFKTGGHFLEEFDRDNASTLKDEHTEALHKEYSNRHERILAHLKTIENQDTEHEKLLKVYQEFIQKQNS